MPEAVAILLLEKRQSQIDLPQTRHTDHPRQQILRETNRTKRYRPCGFVNAEAVMIPPVTVSHAPLSCRWILFRKRSDSSGQ